MPMPIAATAATAMFSIRAMTAAANVRRSSDAPPPETLVNDENPTIGTRRITATADMNAAMPQTIVDSLNTGMPSSCARSPFSADARMATP